MDQAKRATEGFDPARASAVEIEEALASWDELSPQALERLAADPRTASKLRVLQLAEAWMCEQGRSERPAEVARCPAAEELYDYGRGPGAAPLPAARRAEIDRHVLACPSCAAFARSLESRPPVPLMRGGELGRSPSPARPATGLPPVLELRQRRARPLRALAPLAAAALVVAGTLLWLRRESPPALGRGLPPAELLRGAESAALVSPRQRVLQLSRSDSWHGLPSSPAPLFEIAPLPEAEEYRVELERHAGQALERGERIASLRVGPERREGEPFATLAGPPLAPGRYTWRAFAVVRGLERELGARDFELRADPELERRLAALAGAPEPERSETAVRMLDAAGYHAEARALARRLAPSAERDAYLGRAPAR